MFNVGDEVKINWPGWTEGTAIIKSYVAQYYRIDHPQHNWEGGFSEQYLTLVEKDFSHIPEDWS